jgi:putative two-component system response regulator
MKHDEADILVVDDDPAIHRMMNRILSRGGYNVLAAYEGQQAFAAITAKHPDLILLDLSMPMLNGFEIAAHLKNNLKTQDIPIILITGLDNSRNHVKALEAGANDFLSKTAQPEEILARIRSHLKVKKLNDQLRNYRASLEKTVALKTAQLKNASLEIIWRLTSASEYRDNETGAHIQRMSHYSAAMARKMGLASKTVETILYAAPMHDIGKIGIPDEILLKPGKLDAKEWEIMKMHTIIGANILKGSEIGFVRMGAMIAIMHHEKWDGSGYPNGLKGRQIPLAARIVALADVFDALTSKRPYKDAFSIEKSHGIIKQGRGNHFDPDVVDIFFSIQDEILKIKATYQDKKSSPLWCLDHMLNNETVNSALDCLIKPNQL